MRKGENMGIDINNIRDDRQFKALTGTSPSEFQQLLPVFTESYAELQREAYEGKKLTRQRKPGGGQKGKLKTMEQKLFFILYYWKVYPTYDVLGGQFDLDRSKACTNVQALWPVLERALEKLEVLPARAFSTAEELQTAFEGIQDVLIDATERSHCRPQDEGEQRKKYSGKKNATPSKIRSWPR
jgi:hypothetical protein